MSTISATRASPMIPVARATALRRGARFSARAAAQPASFPSAPRKGLFFPGQGAQTVGMSKDVVSTVPAAKELFERASEALGYDLLKTCVEGPKETLNSTAVSQPAIYVSSLAALEQLKQERGEEALAAVDVAAGLSLGEYTALAFAGAFSFEDGLKLVALRGKSMQAAADARPSAMASVVGLTAPKAEALAARAWAEAAAAGGHDPADPTSPAAVRVANYLCSGNYALSGGVEGIAFVEKLAKPEFKARMVVRLAVAGAFHSEFMRPALEPLREALRETPVQTPRIPVISNVDAKAHWDADDIRATLEQQLVSPVLFEKTLDDLVAGGLEEATEVGPGKVIAGLFKRVKAAKGVKVTNVTV